MTAVRTLRVGTRASLLARTQTNLVVDALSAPLALEAPIEIVPIVTVGDRSAASVEQMGGTGVFVSALREALLRGEIDVAVHSYKDLPTAPAEGLYFWDVRYPEAFNLPSGRAALRSIIIPGLN